MRKAIIAILVSFWGAAVSSQTITVAALGDSLTQGYGLQAEDGFVPQLQNWLAAQGEDVSMINAGVSGDTTAGGLSRVAWTLTPDVDALIVTLGGNDVLRGIDPSSSRANIDGILQAAQAANVPVLLIGMQAPGNFGPEYKASFDAIYPDLAQAYETLYQESFFEGLGGVPTDASTLSAYMQSDGIHPNPEGVKLIVKAIGPKVQQLISVARDQ